MVAPHSVALLESGGPSAEADTQELYRTRNRGLAHNAFDGRSRILGGTTTLWAGQASPLDSIDFEHREWIPHSEWPISREVLEPYFRRAEDVMGITHCDYADDAWPGSPSSVPDYDPEVLRFVCSQFSPQPNFAAAFRPWLSRSTNVRVLLHANAVNLDLGPDGRHLIGIGFRSLSGRVGRITAKRYIVCCGGIETARLLLASNSVEPRGVGNRSDLVGRFFQDHIHMYAAEVTPTNRDAFLTMFRSVYDGAVRFCPKFATSDRFQRRMKTLHIAGDICFKTDLESPIRTAKDLVKRARRGELACFPGGLSSAVARTLRGTPEVVAAAYRYFVRSQVLVEERGPAYLGIQCEPAPNPDSRICLGADTDQLGMPRIEVDWRLGELDRRTIEVFIDTVAHEFRRLHIADVDLDSVPRTRDSPFSLDVFDSNHHMGTTRMSGDPTRGVVDEHCRVHGIDNLYIGSASVFPTTGFSNPTFNAIALCLRMSDRLKEALTS